MKKDDCERELRELHTKTDREMEKAKQVCSNQPFKCVKLIRPSFVCLNTFLRMLYVRKKNYLLHLFQFWNVLIDQIIPPSSARPLLCFVITIARVVWAQKKRSFGRFAHLLFPLSFHLCGTGSGKAELGAGWLQAAAGGGPKGREPMAGQSHQPGRTAGKCPAPTAPHQVVPNPIIHATTLPHTHTHSHTHVHTLLPSAQLLPSSVQSSSDQYTNCTTPGNN